MPRITWGRISSRNDGWTMPVAVQVHHALVDGLHLGRFYDALQQRLSVSLPPSPADELT